MKLADIDVLLRARADFMNTGDLLHLLGDPKYNLGVKIGGTDIVQQTNQAHVIVKPLRAAIMQVVETFHNEHTAKLMMLGITEFPE